MKRAIYLKYFFLLYLFLCGSIINVSAQVETFFTAQGVTNTLQQCEGFLYDDAGKTAPYEDRNGAKKDVLTFCPQNPSTQVVKIEFQLFDLATGDQLTAFNGNTIAAPQFIASSQGSGTGASVADAPNGGTVVASCDNVSGCVSLSFDRNGDGISGAGFEAAVSCVQRVGNVLDGSRIQSFNGASGQFFDLADCPTGGRLVKVPIPSYTNCGGLGTLNISSSCSSVDLPQSIIGIGTSFLEAVFPIGTHEVTFSAENFPALSSTAKIKILPPNMTCNDAVTVSLSNECIVTVTPDLLLEAPCQAAEITRAADDQKVPIFSYKIILPESNAYEVIDYTLNGFPIVDFGNADCGTVFDIQIERHYLNDGDCDGKLFSGTNLDDEPLVTACTGQLIIRDKVPPIVVATPTSKAIPCYEKEFDPADFLKKLNRIDPNGQGDGGTLNLKQSGVKVVVPGKEELLVIENCSQSITASTWEFITAECSDKETLTDIYGNTIETGVFGFYRRVFTVEDKCANQASGEQRVWVYQPEIIAPTPEFEVSCGTNIDPDALYQSWLDWVNAGRPDNDERKRFGGFIPNFDPTSVDLTIVQASDASGDEIPLKISQANNCGYVISYEDSDAIYVCGNGFQVFRTWTVYNWCDQTLQLTNVVPQVIKVVDKTPPKIVGDIEYEVANTPYQTCVVDLVFKAPLIEDDCGSETNLFVRVDGEEVAFNGSTATVRNIPLGEVLNIELIARDACGNEGIKKELKQLDDFIPPVAICESVRTVSVSFDCTTIIPASAFDDGSFDNCGTVSFSVAKMNTDGTIPEAEDFKEQVAFSGSDLADNCTTVNTVVFRVVDGAGNSNFCMSEVTLLDRLPPASNPTAVILNCQDPLVSELLSIPQNASSTNPTNALTDLLMANPSIAKLGGIDNCTPTNDLQLQVVSLNFEDLNASCSNGKIEYDYRLFDKCGNTSIVYSNSIEIKAENDWIMNFPIDQTIVCEDGENVGFAPVGIDDILTNNGCDNWGLEVEERRVVDGADACYKIIYEYNLINWCTWSPNNTEVAVVERPSVVTEETKVSLRYLDDNKDGINDIDDGDEDQDGDYIYDRRGAFFIADTLESITFDRYDVTSLIFDGDFVVVDRRASTNPNLNYQTAVSQFSGEEQAYVSAQAYGNILYRQIIKVIDTTAPTVDVADLVPFCGGDAQTAAGDPCTAEASISFSVADLCSNAEALQVTYQIRPFEGNPTTDVFGELIYDGAGQYRIVGNYPLGNNGQTTRHIISLEVEDACNNTTQLEIPFEVKDCKAPMVFCNLGLSGQMDDDGLLTLSADQVDAGSADFCTPRDQLLFTFADPSIFPDSTQRTFRCENNEFDVVPVTLFARDLAGNFSKCETFINITTRDGLPCVGSFGNIAGKVMTETASTVQDVEVALSGSDDFKGWTDGAGNYLFNQVEYGFDYTVTPEKQDAPLNGITTFDIILINKHILDVERLDSPYKLIAADVNNSGTITTFDILLLRRLLLNIDQNFTENTSWRFIAADYEFPNPVNPWAEFFPESMSFNDLESDYTDANFIGVKIGDVNGSATVNLDATAQRSEAEAYSLAVPNLSFEAGQLLEIPLTMENVAMLDGLQLELNCNATYLELVGFEAGTITEEFLHIEGNRIFISWVTAQQVSSNQLGILKFKTLQPGRIKDLIQLEPNTLSPEVYNENKIHPIKIVYDTPSMMLPELYQNQPNPFHHQTQIEYFLPQKGSITLQIFKATGELVYSHQAKSDNGSFVHPIASEDLRGAGVYYYTLEVGGFQLTKKMILIE